MRQSPGEPRERATRMAVDARLVPGGEGRRADGAIEEPSVENVIAA